MRKLLWFTVGFGAACALGSYLLWFRSLPLLGGATFFLCLTVFMLSAFLKRLRISAILLFGLALGLGWFSLMQRYYILPISGRDDTIEMVTVTAETYSRRTAYGSSVEGTVSLDGKPYRILAYLDGEPGIAPGDQITGSFRLRLTTPGGQKEGVYYQGRGMFLIGSQKGEAEIHREISPAFRFWPAIFAQRVREVLRLCLPGDAFSFAQALMLGDSSELSYQNDTAFKLSGVRHILAVSGLHVAILYSLILKVTGNRRFLSALLGIPVLMFFAAMAGFSPSVSRAAIMLSLMMLSRILEREYDPLTELSAAALLLMIFNPMVVTSVSFQLSVASVSGILLFQPGISRWFRENLGSPKGRRIWRRLYSWFVSSVSVTVSASSVAAPLMALYFGAVSLIAPLTNLLVLWIIAPIFYGLILTVVSGLIWLPAGCLFGRILTEPIRYVIHVARFMSRIPMAAVYTRSRYIVFWLVFCYLLLAMFLIFRKRHPMRYVITAAAALVLAMGMAWFQPKTDEFRVTVLDVGQGQSILLQSLGETWLVDCGGSTDTGTADAAAETLLSQSIYRLDGIILTHYDRDHTGGLRYLQSRIPADRLLMPRPIDEETEKSAHQLGGETPEYIENGMQLFVGEGTMTVFAGKDGETDNENSAAILFETGNCAILITGDRSKAGEIALLETEKIPQVDLLIAGHHGSKYSTSEELLMAVRPKEVIISVGENNYGHPTPETLARLERFGCIVSRTDEQGTIIYRR